MYKCIGIDISKQTFDASSISSKQKETLLKEDNNKTGFKKLIKTFGSEGIYVMEATGPYYLQLATFLYEVGIKVSVVNPLVIKRFSQMKLLRAKTDRKDAQTICKYAMSNPVELWKPSPVEILEMQQILTALGLLNKQHSAVSNQLSSFNSSGYIDKQVEETLNSTLFYIKLEKSKLNQRLSQIVDENYSETQKLLRSIPGIGPKATAILIAITNNFTKFINYRQLIAYVGLSPRTYTSGTSVKGKGHICKMGKSQVRKQMYISSWSAKFHNKACIELYDRLIKKGKPERLIKIAIANKLLKQSFAIVTNKTMYNENFKSKLRFA
jgi:transposase